VYGLCGQSGSASMLRPSDSKVAFGLVLSTCATYGMALACVRRYFPTLSWRRLL
jgi:hypothetical protein